MQNTQVIQPAKFFGNILEQMKTVSKLNEEETIAVRIKLKQDAVDFDNFNMSINTSDSQVNIFQNDINCCKLHLNNMIIKLNELKEKQLKKLIETWKIKNSGVEPFFDINNIALTEDCNTIITDVHGDLFSILSSYVLAGAITFTEGDFIYYNVNNSTYYTQNEFDNKFSSQVNNLIKDINDIKKIFKEFHIFYQNSLFSITEEKLKYIDIPKKWINSHGIKYDITYENLTINLRTKFLLYITNKATGEKIELNTFKNNLNSKLEDMGFFYVLPLPHLNLNFKGQLINLGDFIDRGFESVQCLCISELLAMAGTNIINCIGNHEAMLPENSKIKDIIKRGIGTGYFTTGVIVCTNKFNEYGKPIYESYFHTIFCKDHLSKLFSLIKILNQKNKYIGENNFSIEWNLELKKLSPKLIDKLQKFDFEKINNSDGLTFYNTLIKFGFENKELFDLKIAVGNTIFYNCYNKNNFNENFFRKNNLVASNGELDCIFGERYLPKNNEEIFLDVIQNIGHDPENFPIINQSLNIICHDTFRSVGYRNCTETRINVYISNKKDNRIILYDYFLIRNNNLGVLCDNCEFFENNLTTAIMKSKPEIFSPCAYNCLDKNLKNTNNFFTNQSNKIKLYSSIKTILEFFGCNNPKTNQPDLINEKSEAVL